MTTPFSAVLAHAVKTGLVAAALVDRHGDTVALAGAIAEEEAMPLAALVMYRLKSEGLAARLFGGEILTLDLDGRIVAVAVAKRQLFVVAVLPIASPATSEAVVALRSSVERMLLDTTSSPPPWSVPGGDGGSGSGPAELPVIELGITVRRDRAKA